MADPSEREPFPTEFSNPLKAAIQLGRWYWDRRAMLHIAAGLVALALSLAFGEFGHGLIHIPGVAHALGVIAAINLTLPGMGLGYRVAGRAGALVALGMSYLLFQQAGLTPWPFLADKFHLTSPLAGPVIIGGVAVLGTVVVLAGPEAGIAMLRRCGQWLLTGSRKQGQVRGPDNHSV